MTDHPIKINLANQKFSTTVDTARKLLSDIQQQILVIEQQPPQASTEQGLYAISNDERRLEAGGPLNYEYYGPAWIIESEHEAPGISIIVTDLGGGSSEALAKRIVELLNKQV